MRISLATYNIHACVGTDKRFSPQRIARVLREMDADIIALQEVDHHSVDGSDLLDCLAGKTGHTPIAGPTLRRQDRDYGNALLTRLPTLAIDRIDLSEPGREQRGALNATFDVGGMRMQVVATHLGLNARERRRQVRRILSLYESGSADISVLLGDLNEWMLWGRPLRWLHRHFISSPRPPTYPSRMPMLALDRIWVHPCAALSHVKAHHSQLAQVASDHLPLKAVVDTEWPTLSIGCR